MARNVLVKLLASCLAVALVACGDGDDGSDRTTPAAQAQPPATATTAPSPTATPTRGNGDTGPDDPAHPPSTRTGVAPVDAAIEAVLSGDFAKVRPLLVPLSLACAVEPSGGIPQPPKCPAGVADGTLVDAFPVGGPEGSYLLLAQAETGFRALLGSQPRLFAAYRVTGAPDPAWPRGAYGVVFVGAGPQVRGVDVRVSDAGIVNISYGGGPTDPGDITARVPPADFILGPAK